MSHEPAQFVSKPSFIELDHRFVKYCGNVPILLVMTSRGECSSSKLRRSGSSQLNAAPIAARSKEDSSVDKVCEEIAVPRTSATYVTRKSTAVLLPVSVSTCLMTPWMHSYVPMLSSTRGNGTVVSKPDVVGKMLGNDDPDGQLEGADDGVDLTVVVGMISSSGASGGNEGAAGGVGIGVFGIDVVGM